MQNKVLATCVALLLSITPAFALPILSSEEDQSFQVNQNIVQARDIKITDDSVTPVITAAGDIRLHIPETFPLIWDNRVETVRVFGTAYDSGRFASATPRVTYDTRAKTVTIPVEKNFAAGESIQISGLFFFGFYRESLNARLELIVTSGGSVVVTDSRTLNVRDGGLSDNNVPAAPTGLTLQQIANNQVKLTWIDPPDMDIQEIQILRGINPSPASGTPYQSAPLGAQTFTDTDTRLKSGDQISYILRASDGRNFSALSSQATITLASDSQVACTLDYNPVCGSDGKTYPNACSANAAGTTSHAAGVCGSSTTPTPTTDTPPASDIIDFITPDLSYTPQGKADAAGITIVELGSALEKYSDTTDSHWAAGFMARLVRDTILTGYPDSTLRPDTTINRAELAKIATRSFKLTTATENFSDISSTDWFAPYVGALQSAGAAYTSASHYYPAAGVSRAEAVWVLLKAAGITGIDAPPTDHLFPDVLTSDVYAGAIIYAAHNKIISGYENGMFGTDDTLTRAQVAKIIVLIQQYLKKE